MRELTHRTLRQDVGDQALIRARTFKWFKHFKENRESVGIDERSGLLSSCRTPEMIVRVREDSKTDDRQQIINDVCKRLSS